MNNINVTGGLTKELDVKFFNVGNKQVVVAGFVVANTFYGGKEKNTQYINDSMTISIPSTAFFSSEDRMV